MIAALVLLASWWVDPRKHEVLRQDGRARMGHASRSATAAMIKTTVVVEVMVDGNRRGDGYGGGGGGELKQGGKGPSEGQFAGTSAQGDVGMMPHKLEDLSNKEFNWVKLENEAGREPPKLGFVRKLSRARFVKLPMHDGKLPVNPQLITSR